MNPRHLKLPSCFFHAAVLAWLLAPVATKGQLQSSSPAPNANEEVVKLSPFEVVEANKGYYASNTMSGTRINTKVEDLGASISIVTKQQMQDFALLSLSDVFSYEAGTEGTDNFTPYAAARSSGIAETIALSPETANRVRGLGSANIVSGNFAGTGRLPIDPSDIDALEISRGPNASIFGIGNPAGSVNAVPAAADLIKTKSQISARVDDRGGNRAAVDLSRVLKPGVFAFRVIAVAQHEGFTLKPSGTDSHRYTGTAKYRPFKRTNFNLTYTHYSVSGNRPNSMTPLDGVSSWRAAGSPTWDPITFTAKLNGQSVGQFPATGAPPAYFNNLGSNALVFVDQSGIRYWTIGRGTSSTNPATGNQNQILMASAPTPLAGQPLFSNLATVSDRSIYDWKRINYAAPNYYYDRNQAVTANLDQILVDTRRQSLAIQFGWYHESSKRVTTQTIATSPFADLGPTGMSVDVNERLLDGRPNPYFLRPFIASQDPYTNYNPIDLNIFRFQAAYKMDLTGEKNWLRWLGKHQVSSYGEYKNTVTRNQRYLDVITSNNSWIAPSTARASTAGWGAGFALSNYVIHPSYRFYVGDDKGSNVDYSPSNYTRGDYQLSWGDSVTGRFVNEPVTLGSAVVPLVTGGATYNSKNILKTRGVILQSSFFKDRVITTLGARKDERWTRVGAPLLLQPDGMHMIESSFYDWAVPWAKAGGQTRTAGVVVRPLSWLGLYANKSDSFQPAVPAWNIEHQDVGDGQGLGLDYGVTMNLLSGKLALRLNEYTTKNVGGRNGTIALYAARLLSVDRTGVPVSSRVGGFQLQYNAELWAAAAAAAKGQTLTADQLRSEVAKIMGVTTSYFDPFPGTLSEKGDQVAKGRELEANFNPTAHWTLKMNVAQQEAIQTNIATDVSSHLAARIAFWQTVVDPTTGLSWYTSRYGGAQSASEFVAASVTAPLRLAQAQEGKSNPQIRKYRVNFLTNYRLAGITEHPVLKKFNLGGAVRWEDKSAIGYYGLQSLPAVITDFDPNRPIYDKARLYVDTIVGYRTKLFSDRMSATFQLNVRNLTEGGRLQPISAYPTGVGSVFRIVDPRQFILSATFDL